MQNEKSFLLIHYNSKRFVINGEWISIEIQIDLMLERSRWLGEAAPLRRNGKAVHVAFNLFWNEHKFLVK